MNPGERITMHEVNIDEAKDDLPGLIDAAFRGEVIIISKDELHRVTLVPIQRTKLRPQFGSGKGLVTMADDFDEPLIGFEEYT